MTRNWKLLHDLYLASPQWATRRDAYYARHQKVCQACNSTENIHLHHLSYDNQGNEPDDDLMPLCETCHERVHAYHNSCGGCLRENTRNVVAEIQAENWPFLEMAAAEGQQGEAAERHRAYADSGLSIHNNSGVDWCRYVVKDDSFLIESSVVLHADRQDLDRLPVHVWLDRDEALEFADWIKRRADGTTTQDFEPAWRIQAREAGLPMLVVELRKYLPELNNWTDEVLLSRLRGMTRDQVDGLWAFTLQQYKKELDEMTDNEFEALTARLFGAPRRRSAATPKRAQT